MGMCSDDAGVRDSAVIDRRYRGGFGGCGESLQEDSAVTDRRYRGADYFTW